MRRLMPALALAVLAAASAAAATSPGADLAEAARIIRDEAQQRADLAATRPAAPADVIDLDDPLAFDLDQFSTDAMRLSIAIDEAGGAIDLRCIFRGMSNDAAARLDALNSAETAADQARVYREIADLMRDASDIAPAADGEPLPDTLGPPGSCPAGRE
tara:strand:+ start:8716 stop:9192 length:477 start_codon:yes stop_codon:yes gene_type:complete